VGRWKGGYYNRYLHRTRLIGVFNSSPEQCARHAIVFFIILLLLNGGELVPLDSPRFTHTYDSSRHRFVVITTTPCGFLEWSILFSNRGGGSCDIPRWAHAKSLEKFCSIFILFFYRYLYTFFKSPCIFFFNTSCTNASYIV